MRVGTGDVSTGHDGSCQRREVGRSVVAAGGSRDVHVLSVQLQGLTLPGCKGVHSVYVGKVRGVISTNYCRYLPTVAFQGMDSEGVDQIPVW